MEELVRQAEALMQAELERANAQYELFNSPHEGWAVMKEEYEEMVDEVDFIQCGLANMWNNIKDNFDATEHAQRIKEYAKSLVAEAVQVGAMAMKYEQSFKGE